MQNLRKWSLLVVILLLTHVNMEAQKSHKDKNGKIWARDVLGEKLPDIKADGWIVKVPENIRQKCRLIHFWHPSYAWGAYISIPRMNRLSKELCKDLEIIGVTSAPLADIQDIEPTIEHPNGTSVEMVKWLNLRHYCYVLFVSPDGIIRWQGCPYLKGENLTDKHLKDLIKKYKV